MNRHCMYFNRDVIKDIIELYMEKHHLTLRQMEDETDCSNQVLKASVNDPDWSPNLRSLTKLLRNLNFQVGIVFPEEEEDIYLAVKERQKERIKKRNEKKIQES